MYRITANCAATFLGKRGKHRHEELTDDLGIDDDRPAHNPEAQLDAGADRDRLQDALRRLPPRLRAVVVLRDVYDLPHEAIADELGLAAQAGVDVPAGVALEEQRPVGHLGQHVGDLVTLHGRRAPRGRALP
jgi:hypothetical protein